MTNSTTSAYLFAQISKIRFSEFSELNACVLRFKETGCKKSFDACVTSFLPMVLKLARGRSGIAEVDDTFQQGALAVMDALRNFKPEEGLNIISWTKLYVVREINRHCLFGTKLVRVPETKTIRRCYRRMGQYLQSGPVSDARAALLAKELDVNLDDFKIARDLYCSSYESIKHSEDDECHGRDIASEQTLEEEILSEDENRSITNTVGRLMQSLTPKEAEVIRLRCLQDEPVQLRLVGEQMGFSTERARQVENNAKKKMREAA